MSHAVNFSSSTAFLTNCSFYNGFSPEDGAIHIHSSNVTFHGISSFVNNSALYRGGAIYAIKSKLIFTGTNNFQGTKYMTTQNTFNGGGAVLSFNSTINFYGFTNFT